MDQRFRRFSRRRFLSAAGTTGAALAVGAPFGPAWARATGSGSPVQQPLGSGDRLYDVVVRYSLSEHHRTGTGMEQETVGFVEQELRSRGATTALWSYPVDLYQWAASVRVRGNVIPTIPVYFEAVGTASTDSPFVRSVTLRNAATRTELDTAIADASAAGASVAVVPTFGYFPDVPGAANLPYGPYGDLIAVNVEPHGPRSGVHTLLVSGEHSDAVAAGPTSVWVGAAIRPGSAKNVTGWLGRRVPDPVVVTTPLSGWFNCAGERGTGIAVALDLAADLAQNGEPVFFLGTTGHEFENYGVQQYLEAHQLTPRAVFHIGASVGAAVPDAESGQLTLAPFRFFNSRPVSDELSNAMAQADFFLRTPFVGEGMVWEASLPAETPLLSTVGTFPLFHTPGDAAAVATTPELLATAYRSLRAAADILL